MLTMYIIGYSFGVLGGVLAMKIINRSNKHE